jgi:hypothetical protein
VKTPMRKGIGKHATLTVLWKFVNGVYALAA